MIAVATITSSMSNTRQIPPAVRDRLLACSLAGGAASLSSMNKMAPTEKR